MKKIMVLVVVLAVAVSFAISGCGTSKTVQGAGIGAVVGGILGGVIGHQSGHKEGGAVIGAVAGGALGAVIGNRMEQQTKELEQVEGMEDVSYDKDTQKINATIDILFDTDKSDIRSSEQPKLDDLANVFSKYPENIVMIEGHTDNVGSETYNQNLSDLRAGSVAQYLRMKNLGISSLSSNGYGESRPVASNDTADGRAKNRRVEIHISVDPSRVPQGNKATTN